MLALGIECGGGGREKNMVSSPCVAWVRLLFHDANTRSMACAIREAYAATLTVVVLVEGQEYERDE